MNMKSKDETTKRFNNQETSTKIDHKPYKSQRNKHESTIYSGTLLHI